MNALAGWNFDVPNINALTQPIQQGMRDMRQREQQSIENARAERSLAINEGQFKLQQQRDTRDQIDQVAKHFGNMAWMAAQNPDKYGQQWSAAVNHHVSEMRKLKPDYAVPQEYFDVRVGPHVALSEAGLVPQYLDYQLRKAADNRAVAAEGRAAAMHVPQLESAKLQYEAAKREFDNPKPATFDLNEGQVRYQTIPGAPGQPARTIRIAEGGQKDLKDWQTKDAMWAERMLRAESNIDKIAGIDKITGEPLKGAYNPARWANRYAPDDPSISNLYLANLFNSTNWQLYQQAAREGIAAILRKDTGAAVTKEEWNHYFPMYYPQPGDDAKAVLQKKQSREAAAHALRASSGPAYDRMWPPQQDAPANANDPLSFR